MRYNVSTNKTTIEFSKARPWDQWEILLFILLIMGTIGNTLTVIVMRSKKMRNSNTSLFLTVMALSDISVLLLRFMGNLFKIYKLPIEFFCFIIQTELTALISYWIMVTTTIERVVAVASPLKVNVWFTRKFCFVILCSIIIFFTLLTSTVSLCQKVHEKKAHLCIIRGDKDGFCYHYTKNIYPWIKSTFMSWLPSILCTISNMIIILTLFKSSKERQNITNGTSVKTMPKNTKKSKEKQLTIMLCTISISFVVFTLPYAIFELLRKLKFNFSFLKNRDAQRFVMLPIDCLHATNFILYCLSGKKFRDELIYIMLRIFCCKKKLNRQNTSIKGSNRMSNRRHSTRQGIVYKFRSVDGSDYTDFTDSRACTSTRSTITEHL